MKAPIVYFYAAHSAFAYIGSAAFAAVAAAAGRRIEHRPYDLRSALLAIGPGATGNLTFARQAYFFGREIERAAEMRGVPLLKRIPTHHHKDIGLPNRLLIAAKQSGRSIDGLAHALMQAHWVEDADLSDAATLVALAGTCGFDGAALVAASGHADVVAEYAANTEAAIARPIFGSPTYIVDGDMFYGQDRLDMVARALHIPFKQEWQSA
jgi:2-hydroxychromene-2-carboxylate isomerase